MLVRLLHLAEQGDVPAVGLLLISTTRSLVSPSPGGWKKVLAGIFNISLLLNTALLRVIESLVNSILMVKNCTILSALDQWVI